MRDGAGLDPTLHVNRMQAATADTRGGSRSGEVWDPDRCPVTIHPSMCPSLGLWMSALAPVAPAWLFSGEKAPLPAVGRMYLKEME